MKEAFIN